MPACSCCFSQACWDALPGDFLFPLATSPAIVLLPGNTVLRPSSEVTSIRIPTLAFSFTLYEELLFWAPRYLFFISVHYSSLLCICWPNESMSFLKVRTLFCSYLCSQHLKLCLRDSRLSINDYYMNVLANNNNNSQKKNPKPKALMGRFKKLPLKITTISAYFSIFRRQLKRKWEI